MEQKLSPTGIVAEVAGVRFMAVEGFARAVGLKPQQLHPGGWRNAWLTENMIKRAARQSKRKASKAPDGVWHVV